MASQSQARAWVCLWVGVCALVLADGVEAGAPGSPFDYIRMNDPAEARRIRRQGPGTPKSSSKHAAAMVNDVALTTVAVSDEDKAQGGRFDQAAFAGAGGVGENIYGPFEAGFSGSGRQANILKGKGCIDPSQVELPGGVDTAAAEVIMNGQCDQSLTALLDECGGHTKQYHNHEKLICLYNEKADGHSTKVGEALDGTPIYGKYEKVVDGVHIEPLLDACGGHFGITPDSNGISVYHYHTQDKAPFIVGCFGPNDDGSLVTVQQCRDFYTGCGDDDGTTLSSSFDNLFKTLGAGKGTEFTFKDGSTLVYDLWCPCFDAEGKNLGTIKELPVFSQATKAPGATDEATTQAPGATDAPTAAPKDTTPASAATTASAPANPNPNPNPATCPTPRKNACNGKNDGDTCTFAAKNGANAGENIAGTCANACCGAGGAPPAGGNTGGNTGSSTSAPPTGPAPPQPSLPAVVNTNSVASAVTDSSIKGVVLFMPDDLQFYWPEAPPHPTQGAVDWSTIRGSLTAMNKVRDEGVVFLNARVSAPKCAPSRQSMLQGRHASRGIYARGRGTTERTVVSVPNAKLSGADVEATLMNDLKAAGVETIMSGKWHIAPEAKGQVFADYAATVSAVEATGFTKAPSIYAGNMMTQNTEAFSHNPEWMVATSNTAVKDAVDNKRPFFLYHAPTIPHGPSPDTELARFSISDTPYGRIDEKSITDAAGNFPSRASIERDVAAMGITNARAKGAAVGALAVDHSLASIMGTLTDLGVLDNTLIIVTMDHGQISKDEVYEGGTRVALMARYPPKFQAGSTFDVAVSNLDIAPTILDALGVLGSTSLQLDGLSWWKHAQGKGDSALEARPCIVSEIDEKRAVVCGKWKIISNVGDANGAKDYLPHSMLAETFYDLDADPQEQNNLLGTDGKGAALTDAQTKVVAGLRDYLACHDKETARDGTTSCDLAALGDPVATTTTTTATTTTTTATTTTTTATTTTTTATTTTTTATTTTTTATTTTTTVDLCKDTCAAKRVARGNRWKRSAAQP